MHCFDSPPSKSISGYDNREHMLWCEKAFSQFVLVLLLIHISENLVCFVFSNGLAILFAQENPNEPLDGLKELKAQNFIFLIDLQIQFG